LVELLTWLEGSALGETMRGLGVWSYGVVNLLHILGISTLFGSILLLDLRLLGVWPQIPLRCVAVPALTLAVPGLMLALASGLAMITTNGLDYVGNPFLYFKFPAIVVGLGCAVITRASAPWRRVCAADTVAPRDRRLLAVAGGVSLASWLTAIAAGRMIGYW
jgi:hypothetical protein